MPDRSWGGLANALADIAADRPEAEYEYEPEQQIFQRGDSDDDYYWLSFKPRRGCDGHRLEIGRSAEPHRPGGVWARLNYGFSPLAMIRYARDMKGWQELGEGMGGRGLWVAAARVVTGLSDVPTPRFDNGGDQVKIVVTHDADVEEVKNVGGYDGAVVVNLVAAKRAEEAVVDRFNRLATVQASPARIRMLGSTPHERVRKEEYAGEVYCADSDPVLAISLVSYAMDQLLVERV